MLMLVVMFDSYSRYGEIMNINMVRDKKTGKAKGFCFLCYENQKSTVLAVDNMNGIKVSGTFGGFVLTTDCFHCSCVVRLFVWITWRSIVGLKTMMVMRS